MNGLNRYFARLDRVYEFRNAKAWTVSAALGLGIGAQFAIWVAQTAGMNGGLVQVLRKVQAIWRAPFVLIKSHLPNELVFWITPHTADLSALSLFLVLGFATLNPKQKVQILRKNTKPRDCSKNQLSLLQRTPKTQLGSEFLINSKREGLYIESIIYRLACSSVACYLFLDASYIHEATEDFVKFALPFIVMFLLLVAGCVEIGWAIGLLYKYQERGYNKLLEIFGENPAYFVVAIWLSVAVLTATLIGPLTILNQFLPLGHFDNLAALTLVTAVLFYGTFRITSVRWRLVPASIVTASVLLIGDYATRNFGEPVQVFLEKHLEDIPTFEDLDSI